DLVARPDAEGLQRQAKRVGAGIDADRVARPGELGKPLLELSDRRAEGEITGGDHLADARENGLRIGELLEQVCKGGPQAGPSRWWGVEQFRTDGLVRRCGNSPSDWRLRCAKFGLGAMGSRPRLFFAQLFGDAGATRRHDVVGRRIELLLELASGGDGALR